MKFSFSTAGKLFLAGSCTLLFSACASLRPSVRTVSNIEVPAAFRNADTLAVNTFTKDRLFTDKYLRELLDEAVVRSPDVLIAAQRIEAARGQLLIRRSRLLPAVDATVGAGATRFGEYTMEGIGNFDTNLSPNITEDKRAPQPFVPDYFIGLRSSWELDLWGKLRAGRKAAQLRLLATEQGRRAVITSLVAEVSFRYYELLALDAEIDILRENAALQDSALQIAKVQKEVGRITELGVQQFQALLLRTQATLLRTEAEQVRVEAELNFLVGRFPQPVARSTAFLTEPLPAGQFSGLPVQVLRYRPDVAQAELELAASRQDVVAARAAFLPSLTLNPFVGLHTFNAVRLFDPASLALGLAGGLAAPVFNRAALKGQLTLDTTGRNIAVQQYNRVLLESFRELETLRSRMDYMRRIFRLNEQEVETLEGAIYTSNELYKVGYATYLEVITAQRNALEASLNMVETRKALYFSTISFYRALGGGW